MNRTELQQSLENRFNVEELREICFSLGIKYENFSSQLTVFSRQLVEYCERNNQIEQLLAECKAKRLGYDDWQYEKVELGEQKVFGYSPQILGVVLVVLIVFGVVASVIFSTAREIFESPTVAFGIAATSFLTSTAAPTSTHTPTATLTPTYTPTPTPMPTTTSTPSPTATPAPTFTHTATPTPTQFPIETEIIGEWLFTGYGNISSPEQYDSEGYLIADFGFTTCGFKFSGLAFNDRGEFTACMAVKHNPPGSEAFTLQQCREGIYTIINEDTIRFETEYESQNLLCEFNGLNDQASIYIDGDVLQLGEGDTTNYKFSKDQ